MLFSVLAVAMALMLAFPQTPTAKWLHRLIVEPVARLLLDMTFKKAVLTFIVLLICMMGPEALMMVALGGLDAAAIEVMMLIWLTAASGGLANAWRTVKRQADTIRRLAGRIGAGTRNRSRTPRRAKPRPGRKSDDGEPGAWAFA